MGSQQVCRNCGAAVKGKYCSACGQKASVGRITFGSLWHELVHFFTHMEHGFLYTTWQLLVSPGRTVVNYLDGKRKTYQSPVSYFLIWTTAYVLLLYWFERVFGQNVVIDYKQYFGTDVSTRFAIGHLSVVLAALMPVHACFLYLIITRRIYSFPESMVVVIYALGTIIFCQFVFALLALLLYGTAGHGISLARSDIFKVGYLCWFVVDFVRGMHIRRKWMRGVLYAVAAFGAFSAWRIIGLPMVLKAFFPADI